MKHSRKEEKWNLIEEKVISACKEICGGSIHKFWSVATPRASVRLIFPLPNSLRQEGMPGLECLKSILQTARLLFKGLFYEKGIVEAAAVLNAERIDDICGLEGLQ